MTPALLLLAFITKHFICDFVLQVWPWIYRNKGTYGHPGGLVHMMIHQLGTGLICLHAGIAPFWPCVFDGALHYHIDWAKMNLNRIEGWTPTNSEWFWVLLGLDQWLHYVTYLCILVIWGGLR